MILLRVGTDIVTYKDNQFQVIPTLQDPITQAEFEEHGIGPDVFNGITEEEWALFKQDFNAQTFTVIVFTTYEDEPELVYNINSKALLGLDFLGVVTHQISLDFQANAWSSLLVDFENVHAANFPLHLAARANDFKDFRVSFEPFVKEQGYIVLRVGDAYYSLKNNTVTFLSEFEGTLDDFKQYGMTPEDVAAIDAECWREFTVSHDAMNFKVVVFTTYADDPEVILDATELVTFAAFDAILPTNVWKDNSFVIEVDSRTEPEGYPAQSVYYEIYKGGLGLENLLFSGMTPGSHIVENIEEDTVFILNTGAAGHIPFLVKREDENTLVVERSFPFKGAEWGLSENLKVDGDILLLKEKETSGEALSSHSQIVTLGRKTISGVTVSGSADVVEEVLVGEQFELLTYAESEDSLEVEQKVEFWVSKDEHQTHWVFRDGAWQESDIGMSKEEIEAITPSQWALWFERGTLDFKIRLSGLRVPSETEGPWVESIVVTFPENEAPLIKNFLLTPDEFHNEYVELSATIEDQEGDTVYYQVLINDEQVYPADGEWSPPLESGTKIFLAYNHPYFDVGTNTVTLRVKDDRGKEREQSGEVILFNTPPTITLTYTNFNLHATLGDEDGDDVSYRLLINGKQFYPEGEGFSEPISAPAAIVIPWGSQDLILGEENTLRLEVKDTIGEVTSTEFTVVGRYQGLMFVDEEGNYFTTDQGVILQELDFGPLVAGRTSPVRKLILRNQLGEPVENPEITISHNVPDVAVNISHQEEPFVPGIRLNPPAMGDGDTYEFYVRIHPNKNATTGGAFRINSNTME